MELKELIKYLETISNKEVEGAGESNDYDDYFSWGINAGQKDLANAVLGMLKAKPSEDKKPANPSAFPSFFGDVGGELHRPEYGMTLRDWFAGQVIAGLCADKTFQLRLKVNDEMVLNPDLSKFPYEVADAMLKAREAGNDN